VKCYDGFGLSSDFNYKEMRFYLSRKAEAKSILVDEVLPFSKDVLGANKVRPIYIDLIGYQTLLSLHKIIALIWALR